MRRRMPRLLFILCFPGAIRGSAGFIFAAVLGIDGAILSSRSQSERLGSRVFRLTSSLLIIPPEQNTINLSLR